MGNLFFSMRAPHGVQCFGFVSSSSVSRQYELLRITADYNELLLITTNYYELLLITTHYYKSLLLTTDDY